MKVRYQGHYLGRVQYQGQGHYEGQVQHQGQVEVKVKINSKFNVIIIKVIINQGQGQRHF